MSRIEPVDSAEVHILVDNVTDSLSSVPAFVETEFAGLTRRRGGAWVLAGSCLCCAAHGLACLVTVRKGAQRRTLSRVLSPHHLDRLADPHGKRNSRCGLILNHG